MQEVADSFFDHFDELEDPRIDRSKRYIMFEIIFLTLIYGVIILRTYLPYTNGTPSDDTLRRFYRAIDLKQLSAYFRS